VAGGGAGAAAGDAGDRYLIHWGSENFILASPFREGLSDMGYVEGRNVIIEYRVTRQIDRLPLAAELVERRVTVIFASPRRLEAVQQLQGSAATDESRPPTK
jgi:hypothetical protein